MSSGSVSLQKVDLMNALDRVRQTASSSQMVQALRSFCFEGNTVRTYNGAAGTCTTLDKGELGDFCVEADRFYRLCSNLFDEIRLSFTPTGRLRVQSGSHNSHLGAFPVTSFPETKRDGFSKLTEAMNFVECLKVVSFSVSKNALKPELSGIGIKGRRVYAADGKRSTCCHLTHPVSIKEGLTVPAEAVEHLKKLGNPTEISVCCDKDGRPNLFGAYYEQGQTFYSINLLHRNFPFVAADQRFNESPSEYVVDFPEDTPFVIDRVKLSASKDDSDLSIESTGDGRLILRTASEEGDAIEPMAWDKTLKFKFAVNPDLFKEAFGYCRSLDLKDVVAGGEMFVKFYAPDHQEMHHILALMASRQ